MPLLHPSCGAALVCALRDVGRRNLVGPFNVDMAVDCAMRNLTWRAAPAATREPLVDVFDGDAGIEAAPFVTVARALAASSTTGGGGAIVQITSSRGAAPRRGCATTSASYNTCMYTDYSPAANGARRLGLTPPPGPLGNGYGTCATSIASYPFFFNGDEAAFFFFMPGLALHLRPHAHNHALTPHTHSTPTLFSLQMGATQLTSSMAYTLMSPNGYCTVWATRSTFAGASAGCGPGLHRGGAPLHGRAGGTMGHDVQQL
jgi:hypothetical protein